MALELSAYLLACIMRASGGSTHVACKPHFSSTRAVSARMEGGPRACGVAANHWWYRRRGGSSAPRSLRCGVWPGVCGRGKKSRFVLHCHSRSISKGAHGDSRVPPDIGSEPMYFTYPVSVPYLVSSRLLFTLGSHTRNQPSNRRRSIALHWWVDRCSRNFPRIHRSVPQMPNWCSRWVCRRSTTTRPLCERHSSQSKQNCLAQHSRQPDFAPHCGCSPDPHQLGRTVRARLST
jgi:hypothetical protein